MEEIARAPKFLMDAATLIYPKNQDKDYSYWDDHLLVPFATHNERATGYSLVQLIETSSINAHFAENSDD